MIFTNFDRSALYDVLQRARYFRHPTDIRSPGYLAAGQELFGEGYGFAVPPPGRVLAPGAEGVSPPMAAENAVAKMELVPAIYVDQIPPFDITLTAKNEAGQAMQMKIFAVELLNAGAGMSVDDIVSETQMTFVARSIQTWTPMVERYADNLTGA